jgi:hypothetical protein
MGRTTMRTGLEHLAWMNMEEPSRDGGPSCWTTKWTWMMGFPFLHLVADYTLTHTHTYAYRPGGQREKLRDPNWSPTRSSCMGWRFRSSRRTEKKGRLAPIDQLIGNKGSAHLPPKITVNYSERIVPFASRSLSHAFRTREARAISQLSKEHVLGTSTATRFASRNDSRMMIRKSVLGPGKKRPGFCMWSLRRPLARLSYTVMTT